jgi:hypothetical protein
MKTPNYKVQLITPEGKWPYVGNAYQNHNGTISLYIDRGVTLTGGQKLYLRTARAESAPVAAEPETVE